MPENKASFQEVDRVRLNDTTDVVLSLVSKSGEVIGMTLNEFIHTIRFTGFANKAIFIPNANVKEVIAMFDMFKI